MTSGQKTHERRVVTYGAVAAVASAAGTYLYFVSIYLIPLFAVVLGLTVRSYRRVPTPRSPSSRLGLGLSIGAVVAPIAGLASLVTAWWKPFERPGWTGHAMFFVMASVFVAIVLAVIITFAVAGIGRGGSSSKRPQESADDSAREAAPPPPEPIGTLATTIGTCKWWRDEKGYGVIRAAATRPWDIWCHFSALQMEGNKKLTEGQPVEVDYVRQDRESFKYVADAVRVVE